MIVSRTSSRPSVKRVMLADDHAVVRRGLRTLIEGVPGWEVCAEAADGNETVALAAETKPDVLIMDLSMPGLGGVDATIQIRKILPQIEVLILTMHERATASPGRPCAPARAVPAQGRERGQADGGARRAVAPPAVLLAERVGDPAAGLPPFGADARPQAADPARAANRQAGRRGQVEQGHRLGAQPRIKTVETHRSAAMHKVGAKSAADLTLYAARNDLVQL